MEISCRTVERKNVEKFILTFGYGNRKSYKEFVNYLEEFHIICVVDIRLSPRAWSRQWYKEQLEKVCSTKNIKYIALSSLGNTSGKHTWIPPNDEEAQKSLVEVSEIAKSGSVLLLCAELDSSRCHRVDVAQELQKLIHTPIKHLR